MTKSAKIKLGIIGGVLVAVLIVPFLIGLVFGGGQKQAVADVTLRFWNLYDEQNLYEGTFQEYAARTANARVRIEYKKYTDIAELESDLINELAEGKGPDIVSIHPSWMQKHLGKLSPMPEAFDNANSERFRSTFVPAAAQDLIVPEAGKESVYALPVSMDTLGIMYNSDFLLNNLSRGAPAEDWTTFVEDITRFVRTNRAQTRVTRTAVALGRIDNVSRGLDLLELLMLQYGAKFYDQTGERVTVADPTPGSGTTGFGAADALAFFASFATPGTDTFLWDDNQTTDFPEDLDLGAFVQGQIGMVFAYPYQVRDAERLISQYEITTGDVIPADVLRVAPAPQRLSADTLTTTSSSGNRVALANYYPLAVPNNSQNKLLAWDYINFLTRPEQQRFLFMQGKKISANLGVIPEQVRDPIYGAFARQNTYAQSVFLPESQRMKEEISTQVNYVLDGRQEALDAVRNIQLVWQCHLNRVLGKTNVSASECRANTVDLR